jgi:hypothetical protein
MFKKEPSNDVTRFIKQRVKHLKRTYGKDGVLVDAISENTKILKELLDEVRELKNTTSEK